MMCTNPLSIPDPKHKGLYMEVPCGKCLHCRLQKTREWTTRLLHESAYWKDCVFVTLTYAPENLPVSNCGKPFLVKADLQKFFKRLRFNLSHDEKNIKYFACGEYGDHTQRPHYHAIIFGLGVSDYNTLLDCWNLGHIKVGSVTHDSIQYVTGYVRKKLSGKKLQDERGCPVAGGVPEFQLQSRGLGLDYAMDDTERICSHGITVNGQHVSIPRYYAKKIERIKEKCDYVSEVASSEFRSNQIKHINNPLLSPTPEDVRHCMEILSNRMRNATLKAKNNLFCHSKI